MVRFLKHPALLIAPLALGLSVPAQAQRPVKSITAEIGGNYAIDGDVRDATQSTGLHVGLGYTLPTKTYNPAHPSWTTIGLMYNRNSGHGNKLTVWGLTAEQRYSMAKPASTSRVRPYVGVGIGVYRVRGETDGTTTSSGEDLATAAGLGGAQGTTGDEGGSETKTRIGGRVMAGLDFNEAYYTELAYNLTGKVAGARSDSLSLAVGFRF
jgi:hypothetical protein